MKIMADFFDNAVVSVLLSCILLPFLLCFEFNFTLSFSFLLTRFFGAFLEVNVQVQVHNRTS